jgi:hypothetical protein
MKVRIEKNAVEIEGDLEDVKNFVLYFELPELLNTIIKGEKLQ